MVSGYNWIIVYINNNNNNYYTKQDLHAGIISTLLRSVTEAKSMKTLLYAISHGDIA